MQTSGDEHGVRPRAPQAAPVPPSLAGVHGPSYLALTRANVAEQRFAYVTPSQPHTCTSVTSEVQTVGTLTHVPG